MNRNTFNCIYSLFKENIEAYIANGCFNNFINVNFILKTLTHITLKKDYVLDACEVKEDYYREGEFYMCLYTCKDNANIDYCPKLKPIRNSLLKKLGLQKCEYEFQPKYSDNMYISHAIPSEAYHELPSLFFFCKSIENVLLPQQLKRIGCRAFIGCKLLKKITIYSKVSFVGEGAFADCISLEKVIIKGKIRFLSDRIFQGCLFLRKINVPLIYYSFYKRCFKRLEKCICFL